MSELSVEVSAIGLPHNADIDVVTNGNRIRGNGGQGGANHTDDSSRTQYLALQILPELPSELMWKTMDNSFVKLTKPLITELAMTILQSEQADFANAEKHRLAMLQTQNPLEYDYSKGWTAIYEQGVSNE